MLTASIGGGIFTSASLAAGGINDYNLLSNIPNNLISSSEQIATNISGAFNGITSSFITNQQTSSFASIIKLNASSSTLQANINAKADSSVLSSYATDIELASAVGTLTTNINTKASITGLNTSSSVLQNNIALKASITELNTSSSVLQNNINTKASNFELNASSSALQNNINTKLSNNLTSSFVVNSQTSSFVTTNSDAVFNNIFAAGTITANSYIISSSVVHLTQSFSSGSTAFGNSSDDTHQFTGNITASGNISASGTIVASNLSGINTGDQSLAHLAITSSISGAFAAPSSSFSTRITSLEGNTTFTSNQISGAFAAPSSSFSTRVTSLETNNTGTNTGDQDLSGLALKTEVSGAFNNSSASFSTRVTSLETNIDGGTF